MGQEKLILHQNKTIFWQQMSQFYLCADNCYQRMKNDLTTGAWQHDIGCPTKIILVSTSDDDLASNPINNTTVANNPSLLLPVVNGPVAACHHQDICNVCVSCSVYYRGLVTIPNPSYDVARWVLY
jgi:hypothetical protein